MTKPETPSETGASKRITNAIHRFYYELGMAGPKSTVLSITLNRDAWKRLQFELAGIQMMPEVKTPDGAWETPVFIYGIEIKQGDDRPNAEYPLDYLSRCSNEEALLLLGIIEQIGKRQYFNALRRIGELVKLCASNLQSVINDEPTK